MLSSPGDFPALRSFMAASNSDESIENIVQKRLRWTGHVLRKDQNAIPRVAVRWKPEGTWKRGRPKITWRRSVEAEATTMGQPWGILRTLVQDRVRLRKYVAALVANGKMGSKEVIKL
ncbi:hypothetical protein ElyMa_002808700 [Elysia marginata]|uniref:Uncharacterized protein n=1 Tax=Elysia marginata TaxID=1093978 RepID=A0AAV4HPL9_9GAST|nr:hypothetical protein ElyMa_002808700 [Elysia marginata]